MKALLTTLMMAAACPLALANTDFKNVPPPLQKALHGNALKSAHMEDGVLRLHSSKPEVSELVYATFVFHNICGEQWMNPQQFVQFGLKRVELLNADGSQGFAFDSRGYGGDQERQPGPTCRTSVGQHTVQWTAGACPRP